MMRPASPLLAAGPRWMARALKRHALACAVALCAAGLVGPPAVGAGSAAAADAAFSQRASFARNLQLGVGKSVIVDLPEDAAEIYVGDPKVANAIVRSARRIYVSAVANGQTTIFALAGDGRRIETLEVSVGRDVGELKQLIDAAIPNNDIHVRTVANSIILTGTVASAEEAQKAVDLAGGFVNDARQSAGAPTNSSVSAGFGRTSLRRGDGAERRRFDGACGQLAHHSRSRRDQPSGDRGRSPARYHEATRRDDER